MKTWIISILYYFYEIQTLSYADIVTVPVNRPIEIRCTDNTVINITWMTVETSVTECAQRKSCSISNEDKHIVQKKCNEKSSCVLSSDISNSSCLQERGYLNFSYSCQEILPHTCDFEKGWCHWIASSKDSDTYIWKRGNGAMFPYDTGPYNDHTLLNTYGSYVYTDASYSGSREDVTDLISGLIIPSREQCLTFWYHMFGYYINTLTVYQWNDERKLSRQLWTASKDKGNKWFNQILRLQQDIGPYHIIFKAVRGNWDLGYIALDDIVIANSNCNVSRHDCDFETSACEWFADSSAQYAWSLHSGPTATGSTGPSYDHTTGSRNGVYMYLDAEGIDYNVKSRLTSSTVYQLGQSCLTFWYHMYGYDMGKLKIYVSVNNKEKRLLNISGNNENRWLQAFINISQSTPYNIIFEGTRGHFVRSDIAIDDIYFTPGLCTEFQSSMSHLTLQDTGPMNYVRSCVNVEDNIDVQECPKYYMEFNQTKVSFDPEFEFCSDIYADINNSSETLCNNRDNSDVCTFNLSNIQKSNPECFMLNRLLIEYTCKGISNTRNISSPSQISGNSQDLGVVGGVVGGVIILVIAALAVFIIFRRSRTVKRGSKSPPQNINMNGHTGVQNKAFSSAVNQTTDKEQYYDLPASNNDNHQYDEITEHRVDTNIDSEYTYTDIENIQNNSLREAVASNNEVNDQYSSLDLPSDRINGTTEYLQDSLHSDGHTRINCDKAPWTSGMGLHNENQCTVLYPDVPQASPPGNYVILDPKATGFNRSKEDVTDDYELATPISSADAGDIEESEYPTYSGQDLYVTSEDGTYDTDNNIRYKDTDNSMYSHTVDSVYDTTSHEIMADGNEDTYDHFFGKNNDNDYDMTKRTY